MYTVPYAFPWPYQYGDAMIISVVNQKGGVAKTTTALALGEYLHAKGKKILFVDLDPQGNLSFTLGAKREGLSTFEILDDKTKTKEAIQTTSWGDLLSSSGRLAVADTHFVDFARSYHLQEALDTVKGNYDHIVIDTPPSLGILTMNALTASSTLLIPAQPDRYSLEGIAQLYQTISVVRKYSNKDLDVLGFVITRYNGRSILKRTIADSLEKVASANGTIVFPTKIRECVAIPEAETKGIDIFSYAKRSNAAKDYLQLCSEIEKEMKRRNK
jgi:chromosome partitioning protein